MASPLDGPRLKVIRAREHLHALHVQQTRFYQSNPYAIEQEVNPETGERIYRVRILKRLPVHRIAALVGDCVHNLRSALDHLAWRLSLDYGGARPDDTATQFPIFRTEAGYDARARSQISRVGPGAAAVIRRLQPFHDDEPRVHPLWFIRELDNGDKHRELSVTAVAAKGYAHRLRHLKDESGLFHLTLSLDDIHDGAEIARLIVFPSNAKVSVEPTFTFEITLTAPTVPITNPRLAVVAYLDFLANRVDAAINCFEPFYASGAYDDLIVLDDPIAPFHIDPPRREFKTPPEHDDDWHDAWSETARQRIDADAAPLIEQAKENLAADSFSVEEVERIEPHIRRAARLGAAKGFAAGAEMTVRRIDEHGEELELLNPDPMD